MGRVETVANKDVGSEPTGKYSRRVSDAGTHSAAGIFRIPFNPDRRETRLPQKSDPHRGAVLQLEMAFHFHAAQAAACQPGQRRVRVLLLHLYQRRTCLVPLF